MSEAAPRERRRIALALLPLVVVAALVGLFYLRLGAGDASQLPSALIGHPAPSFNLATLDGAPLTGADLRSGKVTVVNIFASWCEPCHMEHPALLELAASDEIKQGKVALVGMAQKDSAENVRRFLGAEGNPYGRIALDPDNRAGIDWGVYGVPETYVVKGDGTIAYKFIGPLTPDTLNSVLLPQIRKAEG